MKRVMRIAAVLAFAAVNLMAQGRPAQGKYDSPDGGPAKIVKKGPAPASQDTGPAAAGKADKTGKTDAPAETPGAKKGTLKPPGAKVEGGRVSIAS